MRKRLINNELSFRIKYFTLAKQIFIMDYFSVYINRTLKINECIFFIYLNLNLRYVLISCFLQLPLVILRLVMPLYFMLFLKTENFSLF